MGQTASVDPVLTVAQTCSAIGDLEHYAASEIRAGKLSADQKTQVAAAQATARPFCTNQAATATDPGSVEQLRAVLPVIASAVAKE
jgi:hypothetical protein